MPEEQVPLAEIGLVVLSGEERKAGLLRDDGKGIAVPMPGIPDCTLTLLIKRGIVKLLIMKKRTEFPYHR